VLRSFGKTFGLAGLRLGFAVARPELAGTVRSALGPWAVSGPAVAIGRRALADSAWLEQARRDREADTLRLDALMRPLASLVGGTRLFRCYESASAGELFQHLGRAGIWVRRFDDPRRLRLGLPGSEPEWLRLEEALGAFA
jgi:cobalamin biosynthetic protein CobC